KGDPPAVLVFNTMVQLIGERQTESDAAEDPIEQVLIPIARTAVPFNAALDNDVMIKPAFDLDIRPGAVFRNAIGRQVPMRGTDAACPRCNVRFDVLQGLHSGDAAHAAFAAASFACAPIAPMICGQNRIGSAWPMPSIITSFAPGMEAAVSLPPSG